MMAVVRWANSTRSSATCITTCSSSHRPRALRDEVQTGIQTYGRLHAELCYVYAYEVDGLNHANLMDDANIPSLLSAPYIGYNQAHQLHLPQHARFLLSKDNPTYYSGNSRTDRLAAHNDGWSGRSRS